MNQNVEFAESCDGLVDELLAKDFLGDVTSERQHFRVRIVRLHFATRFLGLGFFLQPEFFHLDIRQEKPSDGDACGAFLSKETSRGAPDASARSLAAGKKVKPNL